MAELKLQVLSGNAAGTFIQLDRELVFGRAAEAPADLAGDPAVSRNHARVRRTSDGRFLIEDLGSANGTYVNGTRIAAPQLLSPGDRIKLGDSVLEVVTTSGERTQVSPIAPGAGATRIAPRAPVEPSVPPVPPTPPREPVAAGAPAQAGGPLLPPGFRARRSPHPKANEDCSSRSSRPLRSSASPGRSSDLRPARRTRRPWKRRPPNRRQVQRPLPSSSRPRRRWASSTRRPTLRRTTRF